MQFLFRLAIILGRTVEEIRRGMPHTELLEWIAYFERVQAIPDPARDVAQVCAVLANAHRKEGSRAFRVHDFVPRPPGKGQGQSVEEMQAVLDRVSGG